MRISDWSSDVCSSDLPAGCRDQLLGLFAARDILPLVPEQIAAERQQRGEEASDDPPAVTLHDRVEPVLADGFVDFLQQRGVIRRAQGRSEEHTSELQSLMRISYAVFCLKKKKRKQNT